MLIQYAVVPLVASLIGTASAAPTRLVSRSDALAATHSTAPGDEISQPLVKRARASRPAPRPAPRPASRPPSRQLPPRRPSTPRGSRPPRVSGPPKPVSRLASNGPSTPPPKTKSGVSAFAKEVGSAATANVATSLLSDAVNGLFKGAPQGSDQTPDPGTDASGALLQRRDLPLEQGGKACKLSGTGSAPSPSSRSSVLASSGASDKSLPPSDDTESASSRSLSQASSGALGREMSSPPGGALNSPSRNPTSASSGASDRDMPSPPNSSPPYSGGPTTPACNCEKSGTSNPSAGSGPAVVITISKVPTGESATPTPSSSLSPFDSQDPKDLDLGLEEIGGHSAFRLQPRHGKHHGGGDKHNGNRHNGRKNSGGDCEKGDKDKKGKNGGGGKGKDGEKPASPVVAPPARAESLDTDTESPGGLSDSGLDGPVPGGRVTPGGVARGGAPQTAIPPTGSDEPPAGPDADELSDPELAGPPPSGLPPSGPVGGSTKRPAPPTTNPPVKARLRRSLEKRRRLPRDEDPLAVQSLNDLD